MQSVRRWRWKSVQWIDERDQSCDLWTHARLRVRKDSLIPMRMWAPVVGALLVFAATIAGSAAWFETRAAVRWVRAPGENRIADDMVFVPAGGFAIVSRSE